LVACTYKNIISHFSESCDMASFPMESTEILNNKDEKNEQLHKFPYSAPLSVDIGGSFTKMVYWRPPDPPDLPSYIIKEFQNGEPKLPLKPDPTLRIQLYRNGDSKLEGSLRFLKFPSNKTVEFIEFASVNHLHEKYGPDKTKVVMATGGGSYKYAEMVKSKLGITFKQQDEMNCLIRGLNFLLLNVDNESFTFSWKDQKQTLISRTKELQTDANYPYPYLLVNIGSGVSVLKVENENSFERVSGSSLGGGTFWGLCKMLTDIKSFDEVKEMSKKGDNANVDLLVGDIYGCDYDSLGLKADVIASSLGKVATTKRDDFAPKQEDLVRSLLFMISNNIAQIGYLNAKVTGVKRIFFSGGFLQENAYVWTRFSYSVDFWSKGEMAATFLNHNSYLGAVGALLCQDSE